MSKKPSGTSGSHLDYRFLRAPHRCQKKRAKFDSGIFAIWYVGHFGDTSMFYRADQGQPCHISGTRGPHSEATWDKWTKSNHHIGLTYNIFIIVSLKYEHTTFHQENTYEPTILHTTGSRTACPPPLGYNRFQRKSCELVSGQKEGSYPCEVLKINPSWSWGYSMTFICSDKVLNQSSLPAPQKMIFSRLQCEPQNSQKTPKKSKRIARLVQNKLSHVYSRVYICLYNLYIIFLKDCAPAPHIWEQRK